MRSASWAGIEFEVINVSGGRPRRKAIYTATYREGASTEDLGREPRREILRAKLTPQQYLDLEKAVDQKVPRLFTHPRWDVSYMATLNLPNYQWDAKSLGEINIEVIEEKPQTFALPYDYADSEGDKATAKIADFDTSVGNIEKTSDEFDDSYDELMESWSDLQKQIVYAQNGAAEWTAVERALGNFQNNANVVIELLRAMDDEVESWDATDALVRALDSVLLFVEATRVVQQNWILHRLTATTDVYTLCGSIFGGYTMIDEILDENNVVDPLMLEEGMEILIPPI